MNDEKFDKQLDQLVELSNLKEATENLRKANAYAAQLERKLAALNDIAATYDVAGRATITRAAVASLLRDLAVEPRIAPLVEAQEAGRVAQWEAAKDEHSADHIVREAVEHLSVLKPPPRGAASAVDAHAVAYYVANYAIDRMRDLQRACSFVEWESVQTIPEQTKTYANVLGLAAYARGDGKLAITVAEAVSQILCGLEPPPAPKGGVLREWDVIVRAAKAREAGERT